MEIVGRVPHPGGMAPSGAARAARAPVGHDARAARRVSGRAPVMLPARRASPEPDDARDLARQGSLFYLGYWGVTGVFLPFINVYFVRLGLDGRAVGVLSALSPLMTLLAAPPLSALADRRGWRARTLAVSIAGLAATLVLLAAPRTTATLLPVMLLLGLFRCPVAAVGDSLVSRMALRHGLNFGRMRLWGSLGYALVSVACGLLWQRVGFGPMFVAAGLLFLPVVPVAAQLEEGPGARQGAGAGPPLGAALRAPALRAVLLATTLVGAALGMESAFAGVYMAHLGGDDLTIGVLAAVVALSELPTLRYGAAIARLLGDRGALLLSYGLLGAAYLGYGLAAHPWALVAWGGVLGIAFGLFFVSTVSSLNRHSPPGWSATIQAIMNAGAFGLAQLVAGPLGGVIYDSRGGSTVFVACAAVVGLAALLIAGAAASGAFDADHPGVVSPRSSP